MAREFRLPDIGEGLTEAEIVSWHVSIGDVVAADQSLVEVETAKAVVEITAPFPGTILALGGREGEAIEVGAILVVLGDPGEEWAGAADRPSDQDVVAPPSPAAPRPAPSVRAMPIVRKLAADLGVDLAALDGSGPGGTITRADVEAAASATRPIAVAGDERVPLSRTRRTIAEHMARSWREIPHVTVQAEVDAAGLIATRARLADQGSGVPLEALVARCVVPALSEFPLLNATLDGNDIIIHRRHDLGFAVDTEDGLMVVVVRGAGDLSTAGLAARITDLTARARTRSITPDEVTGQTFTISNIGALGGGHGTPIIPIGTTAILSIGRVRAAAVVVAGVVEVAQMMPIDLSYDHRVVDGGLGQRFLDRLVANLESPGAHA